MKVDLKEIIRANDTEKLRKSIKKNPSFLEHTGGCSYTILIWAAHNGHTPCVEVLVDLGADLTVRDEDGTPLENAMGQKHTACVEVLLKAGSPIDNLPNKYINKYADLIEKHHPELCDQMEIKLKFASYKLVNNFIVMKREGAIEGLGEIHTMFNFHAQTVTEIVDKNPGFPRDFDDFKQNREAEIMMAYEFIKSEGRKVEVPMKKVEKLKLP